VDDTSDRAFLLECLIYVTLIGAIDLIERRTLACDMLDTIDDRSLRVGKIVEYYYVIACILQFDASVAANESATTCKNYFVCHVNLKII